jgi:apolipoprotein D and lipocalin family protein
MRAQPRFVLVTLATIILGGCAAKGPEMKTVDYVDIDRFMGSWYVIANIPTFHDGTIATNFKFRKGGFDGKAKEYNPKAFVLDEESNARWGMRFVWPIKADYRIVYLDDDYTKTIIGRQDRDFVWIMARTPTISALDYDQLVSLVESLGYDTSKLERVPQRW